jgi:hypothetical protein
VIELPDAQSGLKCPAADLRNRADNEAAADFVLETLRTRVENPDTRVIASIAGGRKTMGALLYAAMNLLGRETDRVTHVLVNEPFDNCPGFFFPGQPEQSLPTRQPGQTVEASDAVIELADIPFVSLRNLFERDLGARPGGFLQLVERSRHRLAEVCRREVVSLVVRLERPEIEVNGNSVSLSPAEYTITRFLAVAASANRPPIDGYANAVDPLREMAESIHAENNRNDFSDWRFKAMPAKGFGEIDERWITRNVSSLRKKLRDAGSPATTLVPLLPKPGRFALDLKPEQIRFD